MAEAAPAARQRLDKWLFCARILKSRTLAQKLIESGVMRVDGERTTSSDHRIGAGSVLTFAQGPRIRVLRILACAERRGPAVEAQALYEDLSPPLLPRSGAEQASGPRREPGSGRPTKRDRRLTDRLTDPD